MLGEKSVGNQESLPPIPEKRYFTIGEVSKLCALKPHVLRYWEQEFPTLKPLKRRGNRRYYQQRDVVMVRQIKDLLYARGFTIEGARSQLARNDVPDAVTHNVKEFLRRMVGNLEKLLTELETQGESGA